MNQSSKTTAARNSLWHLHRSLEQSPTLTTPLATDSVATITGVSSSQSRSSCSWNALESTLPVRLRTTTVTDGTDTSFLQVQRTGTGADRWTDVDQCSGKLIWRIWKSGICGGGWSWTRDGARVWGPGLPCRSARVVLRELHGHGIDWVDPGRCEG